MKRSMLTITSAVCAAGLIAIIVGSHTLLAQDEHADKGDKDKPPPIYNPYPPGILPATGFRGSQGPAGSRCTRRCAFRRWHALTAPNTIGDRPGPKPPILKGTGTEAIETLGELMNYDRNMSPKRDQACSSCHMPYAGFSGPIPSVNLTMIAYPGTEHFRAGKRTAQRHTYAPFFPVLQYNQEQGLFFGGNFWDSRATGYELRNPDAEQAQHPPVDTQEMGFPDTACVAFRLAHSGTGLSSNRFGARARSISNFRPRLLESAQLPEELRYSAETRTPIG